MHDDNHKAGTQPHRGRGTARASALLPSLALAVALLAPAPVAAAIRAQEPAAREQPPLVAPDPGAAWRAEARRRSNTSISIYLAREASAALLLAWLAFSGSGAGLRRRVAARLGRPVLVRTAVIVAVFFLVRLASLPFDLGRYALSRAYGVGHQPLASWLGDYALHFGVNTISAVFIGLLFYRLLAKRPETWWRWVTAAALPFAVASVAATPLFMALFNTFAPIGDRPVAAEILALAARADVPADEVYLVDLSRQTRAANAFVTGVGPTATIALSDTLLEKFSDEEILFVMAHEMGHYVYRHLWLGIAAAAMLTGLGAFLLQRLLGAALGRWRERLGFRELADVASLPLVLLAVNALGFAAMPLANTISRRIEIDADRFALALTVPGDVAPEAALSTFERLGQLALADPSPSPAVRFLFWSHPTLDERIAYVREHRAADSP